MVAAPIAWRGEVSSPDPEPSLAGSGFFGPVAPRGDGKTLGHQGAADVAPVHQTGGKQALILIDILGAAIDGPGRQQLSHTVACPAATGPGLAIAIGAVLAQFGRIEAEQPDAIIAQAEAVAVAGLTTSRHGRRRRFQRRGDDANHGEDEYCQERPAGAAKDGIALGLSTQDFTAR